MRARAVWWLVVSALLVSGCGMASDAAVLRLPACDADGHRTALLMAQSVPRAALIPCLRRTLPADWELEDMDIDSAGARLTFVADLASPSPQHLAVTLTEHCDTSNAVAVRTDEAGTRRMDHILAVPGGYTGGRYYTFDGGCVSYELRASARDWTQFVEETTRLWTFTAPDPAVRAAAAPGR